MITSAPAFAEDTADTSGSVGGANVAEIRQKAREEALGCAGGGDPSAAWLAVAMLVPFVGRRRGSPTCLDSLRRA